MRGPPLLNRLLNTVGDDIGGGIKEDQEQGKIHLPHFWPETIQQELENVDLSISAEGCFYARSSFLEAAPIITRSRCCVGILFQKVHLGEAIGEEGQRKTWKSRQTKQDHGLEWQQDLIANIDQHSANIAQTIWRFTDWWFVLPVEK